jgi:hypothetical protein
MSTQEKEPELTYPEGQFPQVNPPSVFVQGRKGRGEDEHPPLKVAHSLMSTH